MAKTNKGLLKRDENIFSPLMMETYFCNGENKSVDGDNRNILLRWRRRKNIAPMEMIKANYIAEHIFRTTDIWRHVAENILPQWRR